MIKKLFKILMIRAELAKRGAWYRLNSMARKGYVLREIQGSKMLLDTRDEGSSFDLMYDGTREYYVAEEFKKILKPGMVAADIGANIGYYALMEARALGERGLVYAIEPVPSNVENLKMNREANNYSNMEIHQMAMGDRNEEKDFYLSKKSNLGNFLEYKEGAGGLLRVKVRTLDSFLEGKRKPDIVRMDIEGYEINALAGMKQTLRKARGLWLFIEMHNEKMGLDNVRKFYNTLLENGFRKCLVVRSPANHLLVVLSRFRFLSDVMPKPEKFTMPISGILKDKQLLTRDYYIICRKGSHG